MKKGAHEGSNGKTPKLRGRKALVISVAVLAVLAVLIVGYSLWEKPPVTNPSQNDPSGTEQTPPPQTSQLPEDTAPVEQPGDEVDASALVTDREPGTYTFLLVGKDHSSNSTDTIIVGRMDTKLHKIDCVSIPRDTLINISWAGTPKKINAVYPGFINSGKDGVEGLKTQIKNLLGFDVDCYAVVSIKAVEEAVDAIGGVWFDVPEDMNYWDPTQNLSINISKGYQLLNGEDAVKVCRFRDSYAGGDIERIGVQQEFLKAAAGQILSVGNIPNLGTLVDILLKNTETDLSAGNMAWFARQFLLCDMDNISFQTMPWSTGCDINGTSFVSIDLNAWLEMVNTCLNPYVEPVTAANVNILTSNYSGSSMQSTTGVIAGGADSFFCVGCTVKNNGKSVHHLPGLCPTD